MAGQGKRRKYRNVPVLIDGHKFQSTREGKRYLELKRQQAAGLISGLRLQASFRLKIAGITICFYRADFVYVRRGRRVVEDCKGMRTRVYLMKKRMMKAIYGIEIEET